MMQFSYQTMAKQYNTNTIPYMMMGCPTCFSMEHRNYAQKILKLINTLAPEIR